MAIQHASVPLRDLKVGHLSICEGSTIRPATVSVSRLPTFRHRLNTDSLLAIRFSDPTNFDALTEPASIPMERFRRSVLKWHVRDIYFFDKETHAGKVFFYELISKYSGNNPAPSLLRGYAKVEPLSISE